MPLRPPAFFGEQRDRADARRARDAHRPDGAARVTLDDGAAVAWDALLLATGAEPVRLPIPGADAAARAHAAHARRQPRDHRRARRAPSARSSSAPASSASRSRRRCARAASRCTWSRPSRCRSSGCSAPSSARCSAPCTRSTASLPSRPDGERGRAGRGDARERRRGSPPTWWCWASASGRASTLAEAAGLRSIAASWWTSRLRDQRAGRLRGRRHRALSDPRTGERCASSTGRSRSATGRPPRATSSGGDAVRRRAVLLDHALRRDPRLRGPRRELGPHRDPRRPGARDATLAYRRGGQTLAVATIGRDKTSLEAEAAIEAGDQAGLSAFGRTR